jgi:hypothetical protein
VKTKRLSRGTLYKYKRLLEAEGKIQAKPVQSRSPYNVYYIPPNFHRQVEALKQYTQLSLTYYTVRPHSVEWTDTPKDFYLTPVKEKILWQNPETGAMITVTKFPVGLSDAPHIHPDANVMGYVLSGEAENPDGTIVKWPPHYVQLPTQRHT